MILTFSKEDFKKLIQDGVKNQTIREDKHDRWSVGKKIHFWFGNPRHTRGKNKPHLFGTGEVSRVAKINILFNKEDSQYDTVCIGDSTFIGNAFLYNFAVSDGFKNWNQMREWFYSESGQYFGKIIYWRDFKQKNNNEK